MRTATKCSLQQGDGNIRYYELVDEAPYLHFLNEYQSKYPQRGLGVMPKRGVNVQACEIWRFYKVHNTQALVEPLSFIVPRKVLADVISLASHRNTVLRCRRMYSTRTSIRPQQARRPC